MATDTFETDKISYLIDFSELRLEGLAEEINQRIDRALFNSRAILATMETDRKALTPLGKQYFEDTTEIKSITISHEKEILFSIIKSNFNIPDYNSSNNIFKNDQEVNVSWIKNNLFKLNFKFSEIASHENLDIEIIAEFKNILPNKFGTGSLLIIQNKSIISMRNEANINDKQLTQVLAKVETKHVNQSTLLNVNDERYLLSTANLKYSELSLVYFENKKTALGALDILFNRSMIFILMSLFAIIFLAVVLSGELTKNLAILMDAVVRVGNGELDYKIESRSRDEIGLLAKKFDEMKHRIKKLLEETKEKVRMESELKTASWVQESLFPIEKEFSLDQIRFTGDHLTSTECGGDWWHYFKRENELFVVIGDATGHGTSAALITSASRSIFSHLERSNKSLEEMAIDWNFAILSSSRSKVFMTAQLMQINCQTGKYKIINLSHECPLLLCKKDEQTFKFEYLMPPVLPTLGEKNKLELKAFEETLKPGEKIVLYTDGLFAIKNEKNKDLTDRRLLSAVEDFSQPTLSAKEFRNRFFNFIESYRNDQPLVDDLAVLVIEHKLQSIKKLEKTG